jgi:effector-binding domain-containing protein
MAKGGVMAYAVRTETVAAAPIAVVRRRVDAGQLSKVVPEGCGTVWKALKAMGVTGAGRHVAVYRCESGGMIDVEVGAEVREPFAGDEEVLCSATPAGEAATVTHFGPYGQLGAAHRAVRDWCGANGRTASGENWEVYGHWLPAWDRDPSAIRTDVYYLLKS